MPYTQVSDVQARLQAEFAIDADSSPSQAQVELFILELEAQLNAGLKRCGYEVPVTGSNDVTQLQRYVANKAAATTWDAAFTGDKDIDKVRIWKDEWKVVIRMLQNCELILQDADIVSGGQIRVGSFTLGSAGFPE